jgi:hypothetical protein
MTSTERKRVDSFGHLEDGLLDASPWYHWGPYLPERAWGTVREDYSAGGDAWDYFPHDHARSRAYRWGEDGMAGLCDERAAALPGARALERSDPILKERLFGLTGRRATTARTSRSTGGTSTRTPSSTWLPNGATTTPSAPSPTTTW